jgi:BMFP domain-containing protein YqiC
MLLVLLSIMHNYCALFSCVFPGSGTEQVRLSEPAKFATLLITCTYGITLMFTPKSLDEIAAKLSEAVANSPVKDFEKNARALLAQGLAKLDLVTREEFDVQAQLLSRTREKLAELETRVAALEAQRK